MQQITESYLRELYAMIPSLAQKEMIAAFPSVFKDKIIYKFEYFEKYLTNKYFREEKPEVFYFSIGDRVKIHDGSYHSYVDGGKINEHLGLTAPDGIIVYNRCTQKLQTMHGHVPLQLVIKLDDGRTILSAVNCVRLIEN